MARLPLPLLLLLQTAGVAHAHGRMTTLSARGKTVYTRGGTYNNGKLIYEGNPSSKNGRGGAFICRNRPGSGNQPVLDITAGG